MSDLLSVIAVLALVAANAFFVIGEYTVVTARRGALVARAEAGSVGVRAALRLMDDPVRVISTAQVGITAIGILLGALAEPTVRNILGDGLPSWLTFVIAFSLVTYLSVVLGELMPKALTLDRAETLALLVARPIELISVALWPAVWVLQGSASVLLRPFGIHDVVAGEGIRTATELRALVDEAEGSGVIPRAQEALLHNVFDFVDREAGDIMVPALDVDWLEAGLTATAALDRVLEAPHERYPSATARSITRRRGPHAGPARPRSAPDGDDAFILAFGEEARAREAAAIHGPSRIRGASAGSGRRGRAVVGCTQARRRVLHSRAASGSSSCDSGGSLADWEANTSGVRMPGRCKWRGVAPAASVSSGVEAESAVCRGWSERGEHALDAAVELVAVDGQGVHDVGGRGVVEEHAEDRQVLRVER